jgi:hypothetical protein
LLEASRRSGVGNIPRRRFEGASTSGALPAASRSARCRALSPAPRTAWILFLSASRAAVRAGRPRLFASIRASSAAMSNVEGEPQLCHFGAKRFEGGVLQLQAEIEHELIVPQQQPRHRNDRPTGGLLEPTPATPRAACGGLEPCLASFPAAVSVVTPRDCGHLN